jgi:signal peptidase II
MKNKIFGWKFAYLFAAFGVFLLDQASKAWASKTLQFGRELSVIPGFLNFIYAKNTGVAFSQFDNGGELGRWMLSALAALAAITVLYYFWRTPKTNDRILSACALLFAGIVGNLTDRARLGYVIDFIDVQFGDWHYPTFNVADSAICIGAGLLILDLFFSKKSESENEKLKVKNEKFDR